MTNCVIYARVSSREQEKEGYSIPAQLELLKSYAIKNGLIISKEFIDVETAKKAGRENFGKMVEYLRTLKDIKIILVEKTDRLYRNHKDYITLDDMNLQIHFVKENEILSKESSSHTKFIHGIKLLMAKNYVDNLSEEVRKGMTQKVKEGGFPHKAPFGYKNVNASIEVHPEEAKIVRKIYGLYISGKSMSLITREIKKSGDMEGINRPMNKSTVEHILKNPFYKGSFIWKGTLYKGTHDIIIPLDIWKAAQDVLDGKANNRERVNTRKDLFTFSGILTCKNCGCQITAEIKKEKYIYYHCTNKREVCDKKSYSEQHIDDQFAQILAKISFTDEDIEDIRKAIVEVNSVRMNEDKSKLDKLQKQAILLSNKINQVYEDKLNKIIPEKLFNEKYSQLVQRQDDVDREITFLREAYKSVDRDFIRRAEGLFELSQSAVALWKHANREEKRELLTLIGSNFSFDNGNIGITWATPFNILVENHDSKVWWR